ncbi:MAG: hypothetical protein HFE78_02255 [Clostridiales bacterium]|nr:hypothetical protein [Clostridiales bacterium]
MNITKQRKFKYGGAAVVFAAAFIAVIIIINAIFTAASNKYALYIDMTTSKYYGISDTTKDLLQDFNDDVTIIFCTPLDRLPDNQVSSMIYTLAQAFSSQYANISIDYMNWETETERVRQYMMTAGTTINSYSVIIDCPAKGQYRVLNWNSFIAYNTEGEEYGFNGELRFVSSFLQITGENATVCFTTNHAEDIKGASALISLFESAGYTVVYTDLATEEIPEEASIMVVFSPKTDFMGMEGSVNEFDKINAFTGAYGHLMLFLSPANQTLPELNSYLYENWYVDVHNVTLTESGVNALSGDGRNIAATYAEDSTPGANLTQSLRSLDAPPKAIMFNALGLSVAEGGDNQENSTFASYVLTTSDNAVALTNGQETDRGKYGLMMLSGKTTYDENNEVHQNFLLVSGSADFAGQSFLESASYANRDILYSAMQAMGKDKVPANIEVRKFEDSSLDITSAQANRWTIVFAVVIPLVFLIMGSVVYIRRRHL